MLPSALPPQPTCAAPTQLGSSIATAAAVVQDPWPPGVDWITISCDEFSRIDRRANRCLGRIRVTGHTLRFSHHPFSSPDPSLLSIHARGHPILHPLLRKRRQPHKLVLLATAGVAAKHASRGSLCRLQFLVWVFRRCRLEAPHPFAIIGPRGVRSCGNYAETNWLCSRLANTNAASAHRDNACV